ncbi:hypothetical protein GCM10022277_12800 [Litoribacillus peritrichatus]|uniref:TonB C-terminal domain-containing protein n=1 Tax=Litoribacillus peritrichatus TaxID=718191 RepID=A0ABP7MF17_9GAMM
MNSYGSNTLLEALAESKENNSRSGAVDTPEAKYVYSMMQKLKAKYSEELSKSSIDAIHGNIKYKILLDREGKIISVEFITENVKEAYKNDMRSFIYNAEPFGVLPKELYENTEVLEFIHTFKF